MNRSRLVLALSGFAVVLALGSVALFRSSEPEPQPVESEAVRRIEPVAALGQLEPAGEILELAAPTAGQPGTPRVSKLLVSEGERVATGQLLAQFDNRDALLADVERVQVQIKTLDAQIKLQALEVQRYSKAAEWGAAARVLVEEKQDELIRMQGQRDQAAADLRGLLADLSNSQLLSPIDGLVLEVHARVGERPGSDGVMSVGASQTMQALVEVYESDVARVRMGQPVLLMSENGGFDGELTGRVLTISPQVQQRGVLSTDPTGDVDARVIEVSVALDPDSEQRVTRLAGLKVIARFQEP
ncbi:HlyD family efflux transporter periplasmic adaptor subunit [Parasynechococcus sp.]|uniref:HlyD family efflux transporter periplasmic adaptor subunit n=1 Tax=Parasynechococcus sp. TaxID=3101203 RepID=UPI0037048A54